MGLYIRGDPVLDKAARRKRIFTLLNAFAFQKKCLLFVLCSYSAESLNQQAREAMALSQFHTAVHAGEMEINFLNVV